MSADHYEILGVEKTATAEEIKKAYRKLVHQTHPDKGGNSALFRMVQEAYDVLGSPDKKAAYDRSQAGPRNDPPKSNYNPPPRSSSYQSNYESSKPYWEPSAEEQAKARQQQRMHAEQVRMQNEQIKQATEKAVRWSRLGPSYAVYRGFVPYEKAARWVSADRIALTILILAIAGFSIFMAIMVLSSVSGAFNIIFAILFNTFFIVFGMSILFGAGGSRVIWGYRYLAYKAGRKVNPKIF